MEHRVEAYERHEEGTAYNLCFDTFDSGNHGQSGEYQLGQLSWVHKCVRSSGKGVEGAVWGLARTWSFLGSNSSASNKHAATENVETKLVSATSDRKATYARVSPIPPSLEGFSPLVEAGLPTLSRPEPVQGW